MPEQKVDSYARRLDRPVQQAVHDNSAAGTEKRYGSLAKDFTDADSLRRLAGAIRQHSIENLDTYLEQAEASLTRNGAHVHYAVTADDACRAVSDILKKAGAKKIVKSKSMISEEIHLNDHLATQGIESVETDLGEFIVQLAGRGRAPGRRQIDGAPIR